MNPAVDFMQAVAQAMSASTLYVRNHPARIRTVRLAYERLRILQAADPLPHFSFLGRDVIYGQEPLRELHDWTWAEKCAAAGVQRIEVLAPVSFEDFDAFIEEVHAKLGETVSAPGTEATDGVASIPRQRAIRFGEIDIQIANGAESQGASNEGGGEALTLHAEAETVRWIHADVTERGNLPLLEAESVVRSLAVAMHHAGGILVPLLRSKKFDQYTTTHSLNVSLLAMALAESLGHGPRDVRAIGTAGLLHDLGKIRVPPEILTKPGALSPEERAVLNAHPVDGARIILNSDSRLTLQAMVAFEHHIMIDGGGYPQRHTHRDCHHASTLVHVCDVYDALCTDRPYRAAWSSSKTLDYIESRAGKEFDPAVAAAFVSMVRHNEGNVKSVEEDTPIAA